MHIIILAGRVSLLFPFGGNSMAATDTMYTDSTDGQINIKIVIYYHFEGLASLSGVVMAAAATTLHFH